MKNIMQVLIVQFHLNHGEWKRSKKDLFEDHLLGFYSKFDVIPLLNL